MKLQLVTIEREKNCWLSPEILTTPKEIRFWNREREKKPLSLCKYSHCARLEFISSTCNLVEHDFDKSVPIVSACSHCTGSRTRYALIANVYHTWLAVSMYEHKLLTICQHQCGGHSPVSTYLFSSRSMPGSDFSANSFYLWIVCFYTESNCLPVGSCRHHCYDRRLWNPSANGLVRHRHTLSINSLFQWRVRYIKEGKLLSITRGNCRCWMPEFAPHPECVLLVYQRVFSKMHTSSESHRYVAKMTGYSFFCSKIFTCSWSGISRTRFYLRSE